MVDFNSLQILDLWGISLYAVIVFDLGKNLLFKSVLGHCEGVGLFRTLWWILDIAASVSLIVHFLGPFEFIDGNGDGNITRDEWQEKIEKAMKAVMYITNVTLTEDSEDLYDNIWEAMDCDNATTINMEVKLLNTSFIWIN